MANLLASLPRPFPLAKDGTYTLIHIPLDLYSTLLQPILRVLIPQVQTLDVSCDWPDGEIEGLTAGKQHGFLNISVTPIECSVVCHTSWAQKVFVPAIRALPREQAETISIISDSSYMVLSVVGAGLNAAGRIMELSSPLALAGIPIFFISSFYADFILVPTKEREKVIKALSEKGFELSEDQCNFISLHTDHDRHLSDWSTSPPPETLPPSDASELQKRTWELLQKHKVQPYVADGLQVVHCAGRDGLRPESPEPWHQRPRGCRQRRIPEHEKGWIEKIDTKLYTCLVSALVSKPRFLSLTLAQGDPPSLLIDRRLLRIFRDTIMGDTDANFVPIFLDLVNLPTEVTGIVCGVAGRLDEGMTMTKTAELSYLSTARAGAVILTEEQSARALAILRPSLDEEMT